MMMMAMMMKQWLSVNEDIDDLNKRLLTGSYRQNNDEKYHYHNTYDEDDENLALTCFYQG
jgi:hypothetical protein